MRAGALAGAVLLVAAAALSACAVHDIAQPQPSLDNIQTIRAAGLPAMNVGAFSAGPGAPTAMDKSLLIRAGTDAPPEGSFAAYLADTLKAELSGAGKYDPAARLTVSGVIIDTHLASQGEEPSARLGARFTLSRDGKAVFTKELSVAEQWDFVFVGAVAIPDAFNHYAGVFPKLVGKLLADPDFQAAAKAR